MSSDEEPSTSASAKRKKYLQYYKKEWEKEFSGWLQDSRKGESYAYCKSCNKDINITSGKDAIKKHSSSQAHSVSSKNIKSQPKISSFTVTKTQKSDTLVKQGKMPKSNSARIAETQRQRQTISKKSEKYAPSTVYLQVLGSGARGAPNTLYMFTDQKRYLFNCGECTQRLAHEHKVKLSRLDHIFITSKTWRNIGGLPGLSLTLQDVGVPNITLHGPKGLDELYHATRRFVIMKDMNVTMAECSPTEDFEDNVMSVKYILLGPQENIALKDNPPCKKVKLDDTSGKELEEFNEFIRDDTDYYTAKTRSNPDYKARSPVRSTKAERRSPEKVDLMTKKTEKVFQELQKTSTCTVAYICTLKKRLGTLDLEKCVEKGVKPGPMLGQLKAGEDVVLPDGRIVLSKDVKTPDDPGPVFIVLDVPDLSYLRPEEFAAHFDDGANPPENVPALIVHYSPPDVFHSPAYRSFIKRFGPTTRHLILNGQNSCLGSESVHRTQHRLHLLDPDIFPLLKDVSVPALWNSLPSSPKTESPKKLQGLEELKKKIALAQFQNMVNMEGSCKLECCPGAADDGEPIELMAGRTLTMFYLRPRIELDRSAEPKLHIQEYIQETMNVDGFAPSLEQFRRLVDGVRYANSGSQKEYPKVVFLGTGSCIPSKTRNTSAIVVEIDEDRSMLLDCGEGTFGQLVRFYGPKRVNSFLRTLRAIYISHLHADHHIGLIGVLQARRLAWLEAGREAPAPLYLLAPGQIVTWLSIYDQQFERIRPDFALLPNQSLLTENPSSQSDATSAVLAEMGLRSVSTCPVAHCPNAFGVALQIGEHKITYSGDTLPCEELVKLGLNSSLLIHEATMEDELMAEARVKMHSTTSQAIEQGRRMRARYTVLTHFSQRYARLPRLNASMLNDNTSVGIAFDNMQITMSDLELLPHMYAPLQLMFADHCVEMELKADKRARHRHRANASDDATVGPRRLVSPDCCGGPTSASPSAARRPRYRDSISSRLRAELKGMKASGGAPSSGSSQSGSTSPESRRCNSKSRSPMPQRKPPPSPRPDSINDIHVERAMSTRSSSRTSVNRYSEPRAPSKNSSSHTVHSYRVDSTLSKTLSGIDDEVYTRNATGSTASSYGKSLLTPGTGSSSNMSNFIKILRNRPQTSPPCQSSQLIARVRKKSPIIRGNRNAENRMPATPASSNKRDMNVSKLPVPVHLKSPTVSRESTVAKGATGASYTKIKATAVPRKKGRSPSVESNRSQRTSSQSSKLSYMDTRSDSSATQPENKIDQQFFQRQCAENKRKLLTAFQNQYDSTINHLTLSKEVKPFPVYSRPNLAFKPQLEDIKSSILMLNKKLYCAAEQNASHINEHNRPKSVNETERRKQLNEVKKKFQSRSFFNDSKYEKIEGLNWVSWK